MVTRKAGFHQCVAARLGVVEMTKTPATGGRVLLLVLDHKLNAILWCARDERLSPAKDFVVFF